MKRGILRSSRFSPGNMQPEALEALFVGRTAVLTDVLNKIRHSISKPEKHFILLLGPRGSGKTHFVALVNNRLFAPEKEQVFGDQALVAYLNEEEWGVASYLDFLIRIIETLSITYRSQDLVTKIAEIRSSFQLSEEKAIALAQRTLIEFVGKKTLLVLCENLNDLFEGIDLEGQKRWRAFIQEHGFWTILATSPALFDAVALQDNPFYGFFTIRRLDRLNFDSALELLIKKAKFDNQLELIEFLKTPIGRARVRAIHHIAGGNHRVYVVLFEFLTKQSLDDIVEPFMKMVDDLTPYYQDRIRQLPPAQRKIIEYLCYKHAPITVKQIAADCLFSPQTTAKQLGELKDLGYVLRNKAGKNSLYELAEPLMRICVEVKDNRTEYLRLFVDFLRHWFTHREILARVAEIHDDRSHRHLVDSMHLEAAIHEYKQDKREPIHDGLADELLRYLRRGEYDKAEELARRLVAERGWETDFLNFVLSLREQDKLAEAEGAARDCLTRYPESAAGYAEKGLTHMHQGVYEEAISAFDRALELDPNNVMYLCTRGRALINLDMYEAAISNETRLLELDPGHWHAYLQLAYAFQGLGRLETAEKYARKVIESQPKDAQTWSALARILSDQKRYDDALVAAERAVKFGPKLTAPFYDLARVHLDADKPELALQALERARKINPNRISILCLAADTYNRTKNYQSAIDTGWRLLELDPVHWHAYTTIADAQLQLALYDDAIATYDKLAQSLTSKNAHHLKYGMMSVFSHGLLDAAAKYADLLLALDSNDEATWLIKGRIYGVRGDIFHVKEVAKNVEERFGKSLSTDFLTIEAKLHSKEAEGMAAFANLMRSGLRDENKEDIAVFVGAMAVEQQKVSGVKGSIDVLTAATENLRLSGRGSWLSAIVTSFVRDLVPIEESLVETWHKELPVLEELFKGDTSVAIPLSMLKASIAYQKTGQQAELLVLPIEQRSLLESEYGVPPESPD